MFQYNWLILVKRTTQLFGKEVRDYVYETAFEYQQSDFHFFNINSVNAETRVRKLDTSKAYNQVLDTYNKF